MSSIRSWKTLRREIIDGLIPEGPAGFEGLSAELLFADTHERFYVARRGDQPVGDVYSPTAATVLQAKRYDASKVSTKEVEGDIDTALRQTPILDLFVVTLSRTDAQLRAALARKTEETGLDILLIEFSDVCSDFGALCVTHWEIIKVFLGQQTSASDRWAAATASEPETRDRLDRLRTEARGRATRSLVSGLTAHQLVARFGEEGDRDRSHNTVNLGRAIERPSILRQLEDWWMNPTAPLTAVLRGDEGIGKTWVAAAFATQTLPTLTSLPVTFWLPSLSWGIAGSLETLANEAIAGLFPPADPRLERLKRKLFHRWSDPVLFVLDGANERGAWNAAEHLLAELTDRGETMRPRLRILFTSRNPAERNGVRRNLWSGTRLVPMGGFDDEEFAAALHRFAPGLQPEDFTSRVSEYARLPRYFQLCIRLRERLSSLDHLNKPLLLWFDLTDKIERGDPQLMEVTRTVGEHATDVLAILAQAMGWRQPGQSNSIATTELDRMLPNFRRIRDDLAEHRVVVEAGIGQTGISADHVVLGWALFLRQEADRHSSDGFDAVLDRIGQLLEPAAANDDKVKAVQLAALLTFFGNSDDLTTAVRRRTSRAALLAWWVTHHNAVVSADQLGFFVTEDLDAYMEAIEMLFREHLPGGLETALIIPLCRVWRGETGNLSSLQTYLERWLRLIYPGGAAGSKHRNESPPPRFIVALSAEQLRLSYASASVISFRPAIDLLPVLADLHWSMDFCYHDHEPGNVDLRLPIKSSMEPLGPLLRWRYTEAVLPLIAALAASVPTGTGESDSLLWFARFLRLASLPPEIGEAWDYIRWEEQLPDGEECFATLRGFLNATQPVQNPQVGYNHLQGVAVRRDLPELNSNEVAFLNQGVRDYLRLAAGLDGVQVNWEMRQFDDLLPWLARYDPAQFNAIVRELWRVAIQSTNAAGILVSLEDLMPPADPGGDLVTLLLLRVAALMTQENLENSLVPLTELALLHGTLDQAVEWLRSIQDCSLPRLGGDGVLGIDSLPEVFGQFAPAGLALVARTEFEQIWREAATVTSDYRTLLRSRARHWLRIYAYTVEPDRATVEWALSLADEADLRNSDLLHYELFWIVSRTRDVDLFWRALYHPAFRAYCTGSLSLRWLPNFSSDQWKTVSYEELVTRTSFTVSGLLLGMSGRDADLCRWGRLVAAAALQTLRDPSTNTGSGQTSLRVRVGVNANLEGFGFNTNHASGGAQYFTSSPAWGVDRRSARRSATQEDLNRALEQFHTDLRVWGGDTTREFMEFNALTPFTRWSELEPVEFTAFAGRFLDDLRRADIERTMYIAFFGTVVALALLRIDPHHAIDHFQADRSHRVSVTTFNGALSLFTRTLWETGLNASSEVRTLRCEMLCNAATDEDILRHAIAADWSGNAVILTELASEYLADSFARARALGVSVLAFQGDERACERLARLVTDDPSFWVREHAQWAREVCLTEFACRCRYKAVLHLSTLVEMAAGLAEIRLAASPMAYSWHRRIERETNWQPEPRMQAYVDLFWYNWERSSAHQQNIHLSGRRLKSYCRGENLKEGVTDRQAPWWQI